MFSFIKKLFGLDTPAPAVPAAPYKVEAPTPPQDHVRVESTPPVPPPVVSTPVEGAGVVDAPAPKKKPAAMTAKKKPAPKPATPAAKKPRTRKPPAAK